MIRCKTLCCKGSERGKNSPIKRTMFKNIINKITESLAVWDFIAKFRAV